MKQIIILVFSIILHYNGAMALPSFNQYQTTHDCNGGSAVLEIQDLTGVGIFTITVTDGSNSTTTTANNAAGTVALNLPVGTYTLSIADQNGTSTVSPVKIEKFLTYSPAYNQTNMPSLTLYLMADFCAQGNGGSPTPTNDFEAFYAAARFINARGGKCTLIIPTPPSFYLLNCQEPAFTAKYPGGIINALSLVNVSDVQILGIPPTLPTDPLTSIIRYQGGQTYSYNGNQSMITPGNFIYLNLCNNIEVKDIEVDGNKDAMIAINTYVPFAQQVPGSGMWINGINENINVTNCHFNNFCMDGISINGHSAAYLSLTQSGLPLVYNKFQKLTCSKNGRNNLSIASGEYLHFIDCNFDDAAQSNANPPFRQEPWSGIDIEPNGTDGFNSNIEFTHCSIKNAYGNGVGILSYGIPPQHIGFHYCEIKNFDNSITTNSGNKDFALYNQGKDVHFDNNTTFAGLVSVNYAATTSSNDATSFTNCTFSDAEDGSGNYQHTKHLLSNLKVSDFVLVDDCKFYVQHGDVDFISMMASNEDLPSNYDIIRDCEFTYELGHSALSNSIFRGCLFEGNNTFFNNSGTSPRKGIYSSALAFKGSQDVCNPNTLRLDKEILWNHSHVYCCNDASNNNVNLFLDNQKLLIGASNYNAGTMTYDLDGYFNFIIPKNAEFNTSLSGETCINPSGTYPTIAIGKNAKIDCQMESLLSIANSKIENQGQLILSPAAQAIVDNLIYDDLGATNEVFYIDPTCTKPVTSNYNNAVSFTNTSCVYGNNSAINTGITNHPLCSPNYTNVAVNSQITILSSFNNVSFNNATDGSIQVTAFGSSAAFTYSIQPGAQSNSTGTFSSLSPNIYTITATSAAGCSLTTTITLINPSIDYCQNTEFGTLQNRVFYNNINSSTLTSSLITGAAIFINGTFNINKDITFSSCKFFFTQNAKITVQPNHALTINGASSLQAGCGVMWDGIYASDISSQIHIDETLLQDMENGIVSNYGAKINLNSNNFVNNYIGIKIMNSPSGFNVDNQQCNIRRNQFLNAGSGTLLPPHNTQSKSEFGILLSNCAEVEIGHIDNSLPDPTDKNEFHNIYCGIYSIPAHKKDPQLIQIYNNEFTDIHNDLTGNYIDYQKVNNCYSSTQDGWRGAGICFHISDQIQNNPYPSMDNHYANITNLQDGGSFISCDKAIVGHAIKADIKNVYAENCLLGFMFTSATNQGYDISNNKLMNSLIGTQIIGDVSSCKYQNNDITTSDAILNGLNSQLFPIGLDIKQGNNLSTSGYKISDNNIDITTICGIGINLQNTGEALSAYNNHINFSSTSSGEAFPTRTAAGINMSYCLGSQIDGNTILGNPSLLLNQNLVKGIQMSNSPHCGLSCNSTYQTPIGWNVISECGTGEDQIKGNSFNSHFIGLLYRHLGPEGTLGNIGSQNSPTSTGLDNNNRFFGNNYIPDQVNVGFFRKVYRISGCGANFLPDFIFTNSPTLLNNHSISSCPNPFDAVAYSCQVQQNQGANIYDCPIDSDQGPDDGPSDGFDLDPNMAAMVAQQTIIYPEFPEVAQWFNERNVYQGLDEDITLQTSSTLLSNFYNSQQQSSTDEILATNRNLAELIDSTIANDSTLLLQKLQEAITSNNSITGLRSFEENEREVNEYYLKWITGGLDNLSNTEKETIEQLALSCPYLYGSSVYRARTIYAAMNPLVDYNDISICNAAGVYKNGNNGGLFDEENTWLNNLTNVQSNTSTQSILDKFSNTTMSIYPNPANANITISYNLNTTENGELIIFDVLGKKQMKIDLSNSANKLQVNISTLSKGVYTYKYLINNTVKQTGKIIID